MSSDFRALWASAGGRVPDEWSVVPLESLLRDSKSIAVGVMYPGPETPGGVPLIKVGDIKGGSIIDRPSFCISPETNHEYRRTQLQGDELLITLVGNPGECVVVQPHMVGWNPARAIAVIRLGDPALRTYLKTVLESSAGKHLIDAVLNTTVQKTLNLKDIKRLPIPLPPPVAIEGITQVAETLSARIALLRETNATLEAIAQALFKSWFVDFDPVRAKMSGRAPEGMDEATAGLFPNTVDDLHNFVSQAASSKLIAEGALLIGDGYRAKNDELGLPGVAFVRAGDLDSGQITPTKDFLAMPALGAAASKVAKAGDTAFTSKGTIGRFAFVDATAGDAVYSPQVCFWRSLDRHVIEPVYLHYWMKSAAFKNQVDAVRGQAAIMDYVSLSDQRKMRLDLPPIALQGRFADVVAPLLDRTACNRAAAMALSSIRDELVPRLISGQLRLPEARMATEEAMATLTE